MAKISVLVDHFLFFFQLMPMSCAGNNHKVNCSFLTAGRNHPLWSKCRVVEVEILPKCAANNIDKAHDLLAHMNRAKLHNAGQLPKCFHLQ